MLRPLPALALATTTLAATLTGCSTADDTANPPPATAAPTLATSPDATTPDATSADVTTPEPVPGTGAPASVNPEARLVVPKPQPGEVSRTVFSFEGEGDGIPTVKKTLSEPTGKSHGGWDLKAACTATKEGSTLSFSVEDARLGKGLTAAERRLHAGSLDCDGQVFTEALTLDDRPVWVEFGPTKGVRYAYAIVVPQR